MNNTSFEDFIIKTITEDLIKKYKNGQNIADNIQKAWELRKQEKLDSGEEYLSYFFIFSLIHPILAKFDPLPVDMDYIKTINTSLLRLENKYNKYLKLISSLHIITSRNRENQDYPLKWMKNDKQIVKNMNKKKHKYFYDLFNCIIQSHTGLEASKELASSSNIGKFSKNKKDYYDYILYRPQSKYSDLKKHSELASLSKSKIYLYFRECLRQEIFIDKFKERRRKGLQIKERMRKDPKTKTKIYAIGYYLPFEEGFRRVYFLSKKRHQQRLRNFDAEFYKKNRGNKNK